MKVKNFKILNISVKKTISLLGSLIITIAVVFGYFYFSKQTSVIDQYDAIAVWQNNSEGNWDIAYSIYRQNSDSWSYQLDSNASYNGRASLIAKIPGDDQDPDIASTKSQAIAVWSNTGAEGNKGADIYGARWSSSGWEKPTRLFNIEGDDTDPTIYMEDSGHALVVWINNKNGVKSLYYSIYNNGSWSNPKQVPVSNLSDISVPELGYVTLPYSRYLLTFEANTGGKNVLYIGVYNRATDDWYFDSFGNPSTLVNSAVPAEGRTSSSMHVATHNFIASWTGSDGYVWAIKMDPSNMFSKPVPVQVGQGMNSVVMHDGNDNNGVETIVYSEKNMLVSKTPINGGRMIVSDNENDFVRPDGVYMIERGSHPAVVVWSKQDGGEGEIYFSSSDANSGKWQAPRRIDTKGFPGDDKNPAISPILIKITQEKEVVVEDELPYLEKNRKKLCGDAILQVGEKCEIGVPCKKGECDWDFYTKKFGWLDPRVFLFSECKCLVSPGIPPRTPEKPKDKDKESTEQEKPKEEEVYGGAACGFDGLKILEKTGDNPGDDMRVAFLFEHGTQEEKFSKNDDGSWSVVSSDGTMKLFPYTKAENRLSGAVILTFLNENTIKMDGYDVGNTSFSYKLCTGTFEKGKKIEHKDFEPAPAPSENIGVPTLP